VHEALLEVLGILVGKNLILVQLESVRGFLGSACMIRWPGVLQGVQGLPRVLLSYMGRR
jgi:hypothetical protein